MRRMFAALAAMAIVGSGTAWAAPSPTATDPEPPATPITLPAPSGHHPVGHTTLHLVDHDRPDPWVPEEDRELMVSLWYPAHKPGREAARYVTPAESAMFLEGRDVPLPPETMSTVVTNATVDAEPVGGRHTRPLILLSPGFGAPRAEQTSLAEELAGRGYVVAAMGHNYETLGTTFPDGRTTPCLACGTGEYVKLAEGRARDASFVIDRLTGRHPAWKGARLIDPERIGMSGHSIGGASAVPAMIGDERIKAGVNTDGRFVWESAQTLDRPFLMLGKPDHAPGVQDDGWDRTFGRLTGWKRWLTVDGASHASFNDIATLGEQAGLPTEGDLSGDYSVALTRAYITAFFDVHLRGARRPLLDGPSGAFPEVRFHNP
ncbi:hypothetical protein AB0I28_30335 [Phytomonospora sp. NPDC050363]|uniref:alpha/beta hydrolase family protein n=1 Tax=Phytomonospora sp. NPDC050363 TaxID=3155642 RepID=UPI0033D926A4